MKSACHALTVVVFLLVSLAAFAVPKGTKDPHPTTANPQRMQLGSEELPATATLGQDVRDAFTPVPLNAIAGRPNGREAVAAMSAGYSSAVPLLSCIGAGMIIGGLVSVRLTRRLDR